MFMVDVKIGCLSFIDIYSGGGNKVFIRRKINGGKCISQAKLHRWKPPNGKRQVGIWLAFLFLDRV
jgi:hypothetical protein